MKRALLVALLVLAGCGQAGAPVAPSRPTAGLALFKVAGEDRSFGYDADGYQARKPKKRPARARAPRQGLLPSRVDLRDRCPPVYNQGILGACTAFTLGKGLREYLQRRDGERQAPLSALWLYYESRARKGVAYIPQMVGVDLADAMGVLEEQGCAIEAHVPYEFAAFAVKPSAAAYASAAEWKVRGREELATFDEAKAALAGGRPVGFGFYVYSSFSRLGADGLMPMPAAGEARMGGHAVLAVGYDDAREVLIVRNSYGRKFGDAGYFYMPYAFAADPKRAMEWLTVAK